MGQSVFYKQNSPEWGKGENKLLLKTMWGLYQRQPQQMPCKIFEREYPSLLFPTFALMYLKSSLLFCLATSVGIYLLKLFSSYRPLASYWVPIVYVFFPFTFFSYFVWFLCDFCFFSSFFFYIFEVEMILLHTVRLFIPLSETEYSGGCQDQHNCGCRGTMTYVSSTGYTRLMSKTNCTVKRLLFLSSNNSTDSSGSTAFSYFPCVQFLL